MRTQSPDTSPYAERILIERIRQAAVAKRLQYPHLDLLYLQSWADKLGVRSELEQALARRNPESQDL